MLQGETDTPHRAWYTNQRLKNYKFKVGSGSGWLELMHCELQILQSRVLFFCFSFLVQKTVTKIKVAEPLYGDLIGKTLKDLLVCFRKTSRSLTLWRLLCIWHQYHFLSTSWLRGKLSRGRVGSRRATMSKPGSVWHHWSWCQWIELWCFVFLLSEKRSDVMRSIGNKWPIKMHIRDPICLIEGKALSTPMMRRRHPSKVIFSL